MFAEIAQDVRSEKALHDTLKTPLRLVMLSFMADK